MILLAGRKLGRPFVWISIHVKINEAFVLAKCICCKKLATSLLVKYISKPSAMNRVFRFASKPSEAVRDLIVNKRNIA